MASVMTVSAMTVSAVLALSLASVPAAASSAVPTPVPLPGVASSPVAILAGRAAAVSAGRPRHPCAAARRRCAGTIRVPLDRSDPASPGIDVAFVFVPRRDRSRPATGTIMANPGGPTEAISAVPELERALGPALLRQNLLVVDPRGFGRSSPVGCPGLDLQSDPSIARCARQLGRRAWSLTAAGVAADWEAVRAALGLPTLSLFGNSYGTVFAVAYATRYPRRVAVAYLESVVAVAPSGYAAPPPGGPIAVGVRNVVARCAPSLRCRRANPRPIARLGRVLARARAGALAGVRPVDLVTLVAAGNDPVVSRELNAALTAAEQGDGSALARIAQMTRSAAVESRAARRAAGQVRAGARWPDTSSQPDVAPPSDDAALLAYLCTEWQYPYSRAASPARRRHQLAEYRRTRRPEAPFRATDLPPDERRDFPDWCTEWPTPRPAPVAGAAGGQVDAPVLVVAGELDAGTPPSGAVAVARRFRRARLAVTRYGDHADGLAAAQAPPDAQVPARCVLDRLRTFLTAPGRRSPRHPPCSDETMRALGRFPRTSRDLVPARTGGIGSPADRRLIAAAFATATDALARRAPHPAPWAAGMQAEAGLRGGKVTFDDHRARVTLHGVRHVQDVAVSGSVRLGAPTRDGRHRPVAAALLVVGADGRTRRVSLRWRAFDPRETVRVQVTLDGRAFPAGLSGS